VRSRRAKVAAWSALAFLAAVEAYSRTYLLKHWITDVAGGLIFGTMILLVVIATTRVLDRPPLPSPSADQAEALEPDLTP